MKQDLIALLDTSLEALYGGLIAKVFTALATNGRLTTAALIQRSRLPPAKVKGALVVLVQNLLVFHFSTADHVSGKLVTSYEANPLQAYNVTIRGGKLQKAAASAFHGDDRDRASDVMLKILELGHASVTFIQELYFPPTQESEQPADEDANEHHGSGEEAGLGMGPQSPLPVSNVAGIRSPDDLNDILRRLLERGFLVPVNEIVDFRTGEDLSADAVEELADRQITEDAMPGKSKAARAIEFQSKVSVLKREWRDYSNAHHGSRHSTTHKRKTCSSKDAPEQAVKKRKLNGKSSPVIGVESNDLDSAATAVPKLPLFQGDLVVRPSFDALIIVVRNQWIVKCVRRYVGETTAKVMDGVLSVFENRMIRCFDVLASELEEQCADDLQESATTLQISEALKEKFPDLDLSNGLADIPYTNGVNGHHTNGELPGNESDAASVGGNENNRDGAVNGHDKEDFVIPVEDRERFSKLEQHLQILQCDPRAFVTSGNNRNWRVPFRALTKYLVQEEIENCITMKYGTLASHIVRILKKIGKLEEKHLANLALHKPKELRLCIASLLQDRLIESQEIPKDKHFTLLKSNWLYSYDLHIARQQLLEMAYKAQCRLLQRIQFEYDNERLLMEKAERTDVRNKLEKYLSKREQERYRVYIEKEEKMLVELNRIDDFVAVLRDFSAMDWKADNKGGHYDESYYGRLADDDDDDNNDAVAAAAAGERSDDDGVDGAEMSDGEDEVVEDEVL